MVNKVIYEEGMPLFNVDFEYKIKEWGGLQLSATNKEDAMANALPIIKDLYPDVEDIVITEVKEVD